MSRQNMDMRASHILEVCRANTGVDMTTMELADLCGCLPGAGFSMALAAARHLALDCDEVITPAAWNPRRQAATLRHCLPDEEQGAMSRPMTARYADVATRLRNIGRYGDWVERYAEDKTDRQFGKAAAAMAKGAEQQMRFMALVADDMKRRRGQ